MKQPMKPQMTLTGPPKPMPNCRGALGVSAPCIGKHLDPAPQCCRPRAAGTHVEHAGAQQWLIYGGAVQVAARQVAHSHRACGGVSRLHAAQGNADAAHKRDVALQLLFVPQRGEVLRYGQARSDSAVGVTCHKCDVASSFNNGSKQRAMRGGAATHRLVLGVDCVERATIECGSGLHRVDRVGAESSVGAGGVRARELTPRAWVRDRHQPRARRKVVLNPGGDTATDRASLWRARSWDVWVVDVWVVALGASDLCSNHHDVARTREPAVRAYGSPQRRRQAAAPARRAGGAAPAPRGAHQLPPYLRPSTGRDAPLLLPPSMPVLTLRCALRPAPTHPTHWHTTRQARCAWTLRRPSRASSAASTPR